MINSFESESRKSWNRSGIATMEDLQVGCLQRIATATELMAKDHDKLVRERDNAASSRDYWRSEAQYAQRRLSAAKGQITRLKRKLATGATP